MIESNFSRLRKILIFASAAEAGTGVGLLALPSVVIALLVRAEITELATLLGRILGVALVALGLACWPQRQRPSSAAFWAMWTYSAFVAGYFGYVGAVLHLAGPLLWPAAAVHAIVTLLLSWTRQDTRRVALD